MNDTYDMITIRTANQAPSPPNLPPTRAQVSRMTQLAKQFAPPRPTYAILYPRTPAASYRRETRALLLYCVAFVLWAALVFGAAAVLQAVAR